MNVRRKFRAVPIREGKRYRAKRRQREAALHLKSRGKAVAVFVTAAAVGALIGLLTIPRNDGYSLASTFFRGVAEQQGLLDAQGKGTWTWYRNCRQARAAGVAPMSRDEPG